MVWLNCKARTGLSFTPEQVEAGELGPHLTDEDYELDKRVSEQFPTSYTLIVQL